MAVPEVSRGHRISKILNSQAKADLSTKIERQAETEAIVGPWIFLQAKEDRLSLNHAFKPDPNDVFSSQTLPQVENSSLVMDRMRVHPKD